MNDMTLNTANATAADATAVLQTPIERFMFGAKCLPEIGSSLGKGIREFKSSVREIEHELKVFLQGDLRKHLHGETVRDEERKRPSFKPAPL